ncbi:hypothetical protein PSU4_60940 [Pseudonocardia sulfidoxydans NBRC 16205]|uniref:DUF5753 domain-containing protein n=2 Tax=Pseudonocardia sulfidoxydans TaxID=54011 RepID=A0A511DQN1_9PSEU|nr:hypothetical protein PSU4_60940 [Pseudonocardia sulfidoxydans NBRC 16205]
MAEQLRQLADLSRLPTVDLGVIPRRHRHSQPLRDEFDLYDGIDGTTDSLVGGELEASEPTSTTQRRLRPTAAGTPSTWAAALTGDAATDLVEAAAAQQIDRGFRLTTADEAGQGDTRLQYWR